MEHFVAPIVFFVLSLDDDGEWLHSTIVLQAGPSVEPPGAVHGWVRSVKPVRYMTRHMVGYHNTTIL